MAAKRKRRYEVEGTKSFLYWGLGLLALALWHFVDGWFPRESIIDKHGQPPEEWNTFLYKDSKGSGHYYQYNRITATLSFVASIVCLYIHKVVK